LTVYFDKQPKLRKMDTRLGTWNILKLILEKGWVAWTGLI
jgi:hypothetical protein